MLKLLIVCMIPVLAVAACETVEKVEDKALDLLVRGVDRYCELSDEGRAAVRAKVDEATAPRKVRVEGC